MAQKHPPSFFEKYASEYDAMTDAASREPKHRVEVDTLIEKFAPTSVLDAGCGTGLTARLFAERGIAVVGIDSSSEMIELASKQCSPASVPARFLVARFESIPKEYTKTFDLIVCLGNSISGISSATGLRSAFGQFRRTLKPGGVLVLQMLNPAVITRGETFGVRVTRAGDILYHRYATRPDDRVFLHIVRTDLSVSPPAFEAFVHHYRLLSPAQFEKALRVAGFNRISRHTSLVLDNQQSPTIQSRDLVLVARRIS